MFTPPGRSCLTIVFLVPWTLVTLIFDTFTAFMFAGRVEGGGPVAALLTLFLLPFNAVAVGSWAALIAERRDSRSPAGVGWLKHSRDRWEATLPGGGTFAAGMVLFVLPVLGVFAGIFAFRAIPPWWYSAAAAALVVAAAGWAYRRWGFRPRVVIDEKHETVTFYRWRGDDGETVLWSAVKTADVVEQTTTTEDGVQVTGYGVRIKLEGKGGTRFVDLSGRREREPVERFVRWLFERIEPASKRNSPTAPPVN